MVTPRLRTKMTTWFYRYVIPDVSITNIEPVGLKEYFYESSATGPCNCVHTKAGTFAGGGITPANSSSVLTIKNFPFQVSFPVNTLASSFDWNNIPTSTQLQLIQFFAELDDILATFTLQFWKKVSYGSLTWGVLPLISDIKAVLQAIVNLRESVSDFAYESTLTEDVDTEFLGSDYHYKLVGKVSCHKTGRGDVSFLDEASILLDRLGFHPNVSAFWDLIPFSFVLDYILPIGSFLDSLSDPGWVKAMAFRGWTSINASGDLTFAHGHPLDSPTFVPLGTDKISSYNRYYSSEILQVYTKPINFDLSIPSITQLFNIFYLLFVSLKNQKK